MTYAVNTQSFATNFVLRVQHAVAEFKAERVLRQKFNQTLAELEQLDDRDLEDLGLSRYDFRALAHKHVYGA